MDMNSKSTNAGADSARAIENPAILIVEDSPVQAELLRRALVGAGYKVAAASNGAEGLALAKEYHPAAVVSDINMPVMDGYALCHAIRSDTALAHTPVVLLTMLSDPQDVIQGLNAGADAYVTKPYNVPTLVSRIESLLAHPPVPPPPVERRKAEVELGGEIHVIDAHGPRMLNLLVSTYENAVLQNRELIATQQALEDLNQHLERKVLEKTAELQASERRFRSLIEHASDLVTTLDTNGTISYISPSVKGLGDYEVAELLGVNFLDYAHPEDRPAAAAALAEIVCDPGSSQIYELRFRHRDGTWLTLESIARNALGDPAINGIVINSRDITERKHAEERIAKLNRLYATLSGINTAIVHAASPAELFDCVCDIAVEHGRFCIAWLGTIDPADRMLTLVAQRGLSPEDMVTIRNSIGQIALGRGRTATAVREHRMTFTNDYEAEHAITPWHAEAEKRGIHGSAALPISQGGEIVGVLKLYVSEQNFFDSEQLALLEEMRADISYALDRFDSRAKRTQAEAALRAAFESLIAVLAATVERRDPYTAGHQRRVAELASAIARTLGLDPERIEGLHFAATIHDIGKIYVPAEILSRPGKLPATEFELVKSHAQVGYEIIKNVEFPWQVANMVRQHHERLDGSGYPQGLKGDRILLESRILAVADMVEAMSSHRPYRPGLGLDAGLVQIRQEAGTRLDAQVVDACERVFREQGFAFGKA